MGAFVRRAPSSTASTLSSSTNGWSTGQIIAAITGALVSCARPNRTLTICSLSGSGLTTTRTLGNAATPGGRTATIGSSPACIAVSETASRKRRPSLKVAIALGPPKRLPAPAPTMTAATGKARTDRSGAAAVLTARVPRRPAPGSRRPALGSRRPALGSRRPAEPAHRLAEQRRRLPHLVRIQSERLRVVQRALGERLDARVVEPADGDILFHRPRHAIRTERDAAQHEPNLTVGAPERGERDEREVPRAALHQFHVALRAAGGLRGKLDGLDQLARREHGLAPRIRGGTRVELGDGHGPPRAAPRGDLDGCLERHERHRGIRRMHRVARVRVEDRVILILAFLRGTRARAALEAGDAPAEVPAARALAEIAGDGPHVTERGGPHGTRGLGERGEALPDGRMGGEVGEAHRAPHARRTVGARGGLARPTPAARRPHLLPSR